MEWLSNNLDKLSDKVAEEIIRLIGHGVLNVGNISGQIALIGVVVGVFAIRFRNTKILRWSIVVYLISLVIEMLGILMIK